MRYSQTPNMAWGCYEAQLNLLYALSNLTYKSFAADFKLDLHIDSFVYISTHVSTCTCIHIYIHRRLRGARPAGPTPAEPGHRLCFVCVSISCVPRVRASRSRDATVHIDHHPYRLSSQMLGSRCLALLFSLISCAQAHGF